MCILSTVDDVQLQRAAATWILKTRERHRIPLSVMDAIVHDVESLFEVAVGQLSDRILSKLKDAGVSNEILESVASECESGPPSNMFEGLRTQHQQLMYYKQNFKFVVSIIVRYR